MMSRDPKILELLKTYFEPEDYFHIYNRMIGTGSIGGKACGMLLARKIVAKDAPEVFQHMEPHDSYYLGSDVFYTYIVHNKFWRLHISQKTKKDTSVWPLRSKKHSKTESFQKQQGNSLFVC